MKTPTLLLAVALILAPLTECDAKSPKTQRLERSQPDGPLKILKLPNPFKVARGMGRVVFSVNSRDRRTRIVDRTSAVATYRLRTAQQSAPNRGTITRPPLFLSQRGLAVDTTGGLDRPANRSLFPSLTETQATRSRANRPAVAEGQKIVVDVGQQKLKLYSGGSLLKVYRVSTGRRGVNSIKDRYKAGTYKTPLGSFTVSHKQSKHRFGPVLRIRDDPELMPSAGTKHDAFNRGILFHKSNRQMGKPGSLGCVTLTYHDNLDLFRRVQVGNKVEIRR